MNCRRCDANNREGVRFCEECGARLAATCPACGAEVIPTKRLCGACGAELGAAPLSRRFNSVEAYTPVHIAEKILTSRAALEGERKQVTVLFADMQGSMEVLVDRDPEEARKILDPVLERMMEAVHNYEGTVNQVMGDGIMALFGAPLAHEDHAVRASYAALRMRDAVKQYAEEIHRTRGIPIHIRVGLNSGQVVVRSIASDLRMDYTAVGQTTHLAARMEQMARPDTIMATAGCVRLAEGYVMVAPLGLLPVKGMAEPVEVYEITGIGTVRSRLEVAVGRGLSRFVGREAEREQLRRALESAAQGQGQVLAVVGEPGAGKSRLIYEVVQRERRQGWLFLETAAAAYGSSTAYLPVIDLLRSYFHIEPRDDVQQLRDKVAARLFALGEEVFSMLPALLALLGAPADDPTWKVLASSQRRRRTLEAVARLLVCESLVQPVCLVVEDLHWIDSETQAVLDELVESLPRARLLVLVSYRHEYQHRWSGKSYYAQVRLDSLPMEGAAELLDGLLGANEALMPLKRLLIDQTAGNPFFLEECARGLVEAGVLVGDLAGYVLATPVQAIHVPATVQAVIAARIDRLAPDEKALLQTAAVIGKDVPFALLHAIVGESEDCLRRGLARLQAAELLFQGRLFPDLEYTFKHALTHEVAYGNLLTDQRRALHGRIVHVIEKLAADRPGDHAERLAHHARAGELWDRAARYLRQAGDKAFAHSANREARAWFEQALEAVKRLPETTETRAAAADLHLGLRNTLTLLGEHERTLVHLGEAAALAEAIDDQWRLGRALSFEVNCLFLLGQYGRAIDSGRRARAVADKLNDLPLRTVTDMYVGRAYLRRGDFSHAIELFGGIVATLTGELADDHLGLPVLPSVFARSHLVEALTDVGRFAEGARYADELIALAEGTNHPDTLFWAYHGAGLHYLGRGEVRRAIGTLERGYRVCQTYDIPAHIPLISSELGLARALDGAAAEAVPMLQRAADEAARRKQAASFPKVVLLLGEVYLLAGDLDQAADAATRALDLFRRQQERGHEALAMRLLGDIATHTSAHDAEAHYRMARALADALGMRPLVARCDLGLGRVFHKAGQPARAIAALEVSCAQFRELGMATDLARAEAELKAAG
jgi:class 3 adenylate cyclase/tetratricopeptide (TPR) repeat protein